MLKKSRVLLSDVDAPYIKFYNSEYFIIDAINNRAMVRLGGDERGAELIIDEDIWFTATTGSPTQSAFILDGVFSVYRDTSANWVGYIFPIPTVVGSLYEISFEVVQNNVAVRVGSDAGYGQVLDEAPSLSAGSAYTYRFVAESTISYLLIKPTIDNQYSKFGNVSCKEVQPSSPEKITNGNFATDLSGWTDYTLGTGTVVANGGYMELYRLDQNNSGRGSQTVTTKVGYLYELTVHVSRSSVYCSIGTTALGNNIYSSSALPANVTQKIRFIAQTTSTFIMFSAWTDGTTCRVDCVSIKEVLPGQIISGTPEQLIAQGYLYYSRADAYATRESSPGVWEQVATNTLRRKYDGSIYIEPSVQNTVRNPRMVGAAIGSPGTAPTYWGGNFSGSGLTQTITGFGSENGLDYVELSVSGTTTGDIAPIIYLDGATGYVPASSGQVRTGSIFIKVIDTFSADTYTFDLSMREHDASNAYLRQTLISLKNASSSSYTRVVNTATIGASTAYILLGLRLGSASGQNVSFKVRIAWPQEELSGASTTPILPAPGATGSATRAGDVFRLNTAGLYIPGDGTLAVELVNSYATNPYNGSNITNAIVVNGSGPNWLQIRDKDTTLTGFQAVIGDGISTTTQIVGGVPADTITRVAMRYKVSAADAIVSVDGAFIAAIARKWSGLYHTYIGIGGSEFGSDQMTGTMRYVSGDITPKSGRDLILESSVVKDDGKYWYNSGWNSLADPVFILDPLNNRAMVRLGGDERGLELIPNSTFDTDISNWTDTSSAGGAIAWSSGLLAITNTTGTGRARADVVTTVVGKLYELAIQNISGGSVYVYCGHTGSITNYVNGSMLSASTTGTFRFVAANTDANVQLVNFNAGTTILVDNVSIKEVQPSSAELVPNGNFLLDPIGNGWTNSTVGTAPGIYWSSDALAIPRIDISNYSRGIYTMSTSAGRLYELSLSNITVVASNLLYHVGTTSLGTDIITQTSLSSGSSATVRFIAKSSTTYLWLRCGTDGVTGLLDNISVKEVLPGQIISGTPEQLIAKGYLSYSRADAYATRESAAGVWEQVATNTLRRKYDGSIYIEPSITNACRNPRCVGASVPSTYPTYWAPSGSGVTFTTVGTGVSNGVDYIDLRVSGTTAAVFGQILFDGVDPGVAAANGEDWTAGVFLSVIDGSLTNVTSININVNMTDGSASLASWTAISNLQNVLTNKLTRYSGTVTLNNASTTRVRHLIGFNWTNGVYIDFTLRIGWPTLTKSSAVTTPILPAPGGIGAATRAADDFRLNTANLCIPGDGTLVFEVIPSANLNPSTVSSYPRIINIYASGNNILAVNEHLGASYGPAFTFGDGTTQSSLTLSGGAAAGSVVRGAGRYRTSAADAAVSYNGAAAQTVSRAVAFSIPTNIGLGSDGAGAYMMTGTMRYMAIYNNALSNSFIEQESVPNV